MTVLQIVMGCVLFVLLMMFVVSTAIEIWENEKLRKTYKILAYLGIVILISMAISSSISKETHLFFSSIFLKYIQVMYWLSLSLGAWFMSKNFIFKMRKTFSNASQPSA